MAVAIEPLRPGDWDAVRRIYEAGLATRDASFEAAAPAWEAWSARHLAEPRLVAVADGHVLGFAALSPVSARPVYAGVAEVSIYVDAAVRGKGIGRRLLDDLVRRSEEAGIWMLQASIFPENAASVRLHEACGFRLVGRRERIGWQEHRWRDTLLYERRSATIGS